ncbi:MAG: hypothetical protein ACP5XB_27485 [Isosphaeraceae bacterium]
MATGPNDIDEIFHRMAVIRRELHTNVRESVAGAEAFADWGRFTWTYPWIALGAAAAVGYVVYTSGHQKGTADTANLADGATAVEPVAGASAKSQGTSKIGPKILLAAWDIVFPVAVHAGQNYLLRWLEQQYPTRPEGRTALSQSAGERGGWTGQAGR